MKAAFIFTSAALCAVSVADWRFDAYPADSVPCEKKITDTSGSTFDDYCHDVSGQGWAQITGSAMSIEGQSVQFFSDNVCQNMMFSVDDTSGCVWENNYAAGEAPAIGSWRPHQS